MANIGEPVKEFTITLEPHQIPVPSKLDPMPAPAETTAPASPEKELTPA